MVATGLYVGILSIVQVLIGLMVLNDDNILISFSLRGLHQCNLLMSDIRVVVEVLVHSLSSHGINSINKNLEIEDAPPIKLGLGLCELERQSVTPCTENLSEGCDWHPKIDNVSALLVEDNADSSILATFICHHKHQQCVILLSNVFYELVFVSFDNVRIFQATIAALRNNWLSSIVYRFLIFGFFLHLVAKTFHKVLVIIVHRRVYNWNLLLIHNFKVALSLGFFKHGDCGIGQDFTLGNIFNTILLLSLLQRSRVYSLSLWLIFAFICIVELICIVLLHYVVGSLAFKLIILLVFKFLIAVVRFL